MRHLHFFDRRRADSDSFDTQPGASRRETFRFDQVLYSDDTILVTPALILCATGKWRRKEREIRIQDVGYVEMPQLGGNNNKRRRPWWCRWIMKRRLLHNLQVEILTYRGGWPTASHVLLCAENPGAAALAIENAKGIVY